MSLQPRPTRSRYQGLPSIDQLHLDYHVYPGQPLVSAACIVQLFRKVEDAAERRSHGRWCEAEGNSQIPGAGGQASKAVQCLMGYRRHGDLDQVIADLHAAWRHTVGGGNFDEAFEPGQEKAEALEPALREALVSWYKSRHRHMWRENQYRASWRTKGASGHGRTIAIGRICPCGAEQRRYYDEQARRWKWGPK